VGRNGRNARLIICVVENKPSPFANASHQQPTPIPTMASTTERNTVPNILNNIRNCSEEQNRDTPGANGVTGEEREVTRRVQAEAEDEPREDETSNISMKRGRGRPRKEKSHIVMQAGMASIPRTRGRPRKDKTNIIMSTIEAEASEEESEESAHGHATRKSRRTVKKRISSQMFEESVSESNEDGDYDDDFGPPAKKRGRRGSKPTRRRIAMASSSANGGPPTMIPPVPVEKNKRRVATIPAAEVEREIPEGIFDEFWGSEDEENIVSQWTREHEVVLQNTSPAENALWKKAFQLFNQPAPKLLPPHIPIDVSENETVMDPDNEDLEDNEGLKNTNWSPPVCALFGEIMCCPAFSGRPDYLQYVLALAFYLRVGATDEFPKPELPASRRQLVVDEFKRLSKGPVDEENLLQTIENVEGRERLPHHRFLRFLEKDYNAKKAKWKTKKAKGLVKADFTAIVEAWDKYAIDSTKVGLFPLKEYATDWNRKFTKSPSSKSKKKKHSSEDILRLKREYILSTWRDREKEKRAGAAKRARKGKKTERRGAVVLADHGDAAVELGDEPSSSSHTEREAMSDGPNVTLDEDAVGEPSEPTQPPQSSRRERHRVRGRQILTVHDFERYLSELEWLSDSES
jgi:hypothetical protein